MKKLLLAIVLIVGCDEVENIPTEPNYTHGCLDSQATNYDSTAVIDNNSCEYEEETMFCALKYTYYEYSYENWDHPDFDLDNPPLEISMEYYRCVDDTSEELCLYKAEHGCNEWFWYPEGPLWDSCESDLSYYGTWASQSCYGFCADHGGVGGEDLDDEFCSSLPFQSGP